MLVVSNSTGTEFSGSNVHALFTLPVAAAAVLPTGCEQCLYVSYAWPPAGEGVVINTPLVPANCGPRGQTASAKWLHAVHVPLAVQQGQRQETDGIIATGAGSTAGSDKTEQAPMLTLLVGYIAAADAVFVQLVLMRLAVLFFRVCGLSGVRLCVMLPCVCKARWHPKQPDAAAHAANARA